MASVNSHRWNILTSLLIYGRKTPYHIQPLPLLLTPLHLARWPDREISTCLSILKSSHFKHFWRVASCFGTKRRDVNTVQMIQNRISQDE